MMIKIASARPSGDSGGGSWEGRGVPYRARGVMPTVLPQAHAKWLLSAGEWGFVVGCAVNVSVRRAQPESKT